MAEPNQAGNGEPQAPTEEYQKKLLTFLAEIPELGGPEVKSGTPALKTPFKQADIDALNDKLTTDPRFKKYTGWEHKGLLEKWLVDKTTTCNEFCQKCALAMGSKEAIGRFDIADQLNGRGLGHVWVPASSGATPEFGDIFRLFEVKPDHNQAPLNHMAVSLRVSGADWYTVESGQGGPGKGYDAILRKKRGWKPSSLRGWVSMKALLNSDKPLPYWLGGWWEVEEGPYDTYYYYFAAGGKATYAAVRPQIITSPPLAGQFVGNFAIMGMFGLDITWQSTDVPESFTLAVQEQTKRRYVMEGKTARGIKLTATRLLPPDPFG
jgi:hypothetical protein